MRIISASEDTLGIAVCRVFLSELQRVVAVHGRAVVAIPGGTSVSGFFTALAAAADTLSEVQWDAVHFVWLDERCVPLEHPQSNFLGAQQLLEQLPAHFHPCVYKVSPQATAAEYSRLLAALGGQIHIAVVGVGADGHIASLFPQHLALECDDDGYIAVTDAPKEPPARVTVSVATLRSVPAVFLLFVGEQKREAYSLFIDAHASIHTIPARIVSGAQQLFVCVTFLV